MWSSWIQGFSCNGSNGSLNKGVRLKIPHPTCACVLPTSLFILAVYESELVCPSHGGCPGLDKQLHCLHMPNDNDGKHLRILSVLDIF